MKFLIPSYMRADRQRTLRELLRLGVDKDDIFIGVQTRSDFDIYKNCADVWRKVGTLVKIVCYNAKPCGNIAAIVKHEIPLRHRGFARQTFGNTFLIRLFRNVPF